MQPFPVGIGQEAEMIPHSSGISMNFALMRTSRPALAHRTGHWIGILEIFAYQNILYCKIRQNTTRYPSFIPVSHPKSEEEVL